MIVWVAVSWLLLSVAFGIVWAASALALKAARRRWPQVAADPAWRSKPWQPHRSGPGER